MSIIRCSMPECPYVTEDVDAGIAAALLMVHNYVDSNSTTVEASPAGGKQKAPKIDRPCISKDSSDETWNAFQVRWAMFKREQP